MKTILILGSTSLIGAELSRQFSMGNKIILSGRNQERLVEIAEYCEKFGAIAVKTVAADLSKSIQVILDINSEWPINIIIDAASAGSAYRDSKISHELILDIFQADVISHLNIYRQLELINHKHPDIIFISTILALVKTQDREIYYYAKRIVEIYLEKLMLFDPEIRVLIFRIGKLIDPKQGHKTSTIMVQRIRHDLLAGYTSVNYGFSGHILFFLHALHPSLLRFFLKIQRASRRKGLRPR